MNLTHKYSIQRIVGKNTHYIFRLFIDDSIRKFLIMNVENIAHHSNLIAVEYENGDDKLNCLNGMGQKLRDLTVLGDCVFNYFSRYKFSLIIEGNFISGTYIFVVNSWGAWTTNKMWLLIKSS